MTALSTRAVIAPWWANLRYRWRLLCDRVYEATHEPLDLGDKDLDVIFFRAAVVAKRADDQRGIRYSNGAVRDASGRYATLTGLDEIGENTDPATEMEAA